MGFLGNQPQSFPLLYTPINFFRRVPLSVNGRLAKRDVINEVISSYNLDTYLAVSYKKKAIRCFNSHLNLFSSRVNCS